MKINELHDLTVQWAKDRLIIPNGKITTQALKLGSEFGELCGHLANNKPIEDDVGDCLVVCTILCQLQDNTLSLPEILDEIEPEVHKTPLVPQAAYYLGMLQDNTIKGQDFTVNVRNFLHQLEGIALLRHTNFEAAWEVAYNDIMDRKGKLNKDGNFIKESDPAYKDL